MVASVSEIKLAAVRPEELVRQRVRRFLKLLPEVLNGERPEAVHDLRVWSRRLQQVLVTMFPETQQNRANSVIRTARRARRRLSGWRDCDVLMVLLDRKLRRLHDREEQRAWQVVHVHLVKRREKEIRRARRGLARREFFTLAQRTEDLLKQSGLVPESGHDTGNAQFISTVSEFVKTAYAEWQAALARALESTSQADTHMFRIKTKKLRYRIELASELGYKELRLQLNWLKQLQDRLGQWHDRAEFPRIATEAIADPKFLLDELRPASLLLKRLARERLSEETNVKLLLSAAKDGSEFQELEAWIGNHSGAAGSLDITPSIRINTIPG
jgi:CHAD domain-containing protein